LAPLKSMQLAGLQAWGERERKVASKAGGSCLGTSKIAT
jgi:hypothetical protein